MLSTSKTNAVWKWVLGVVPLSAIALYTPASLAQASLPNATTICAYSPDSNVPNALGMRSFITAGQVGDNTVFVYEQFSTPGLNQNDSNLLTDVQSRRTLTIYNKPIAEARQILVDSPKSYAALLGVEESLTADFSFAAVNNTLTCEDVSADKAAIAPSPTAPQPNFADLPNGNYRLTSASYAPGVVKDAELIKNGGVLFLFRKFGDKVTGRFSYIDSDLSACVTGKLEGNKVTGQAYTDNDGFYPEESTAVFLGPGGYLQLEENKGAVPRTGTRSYNNATLNLEKFSRINAGTVLPPESCS